MHVISKKKIRDFYSIHADSKHHLLAWHTVVKNSRFENLDELRKTFPQVDSVKPFCVFNIGNAYRLIAAVHFNTGKVLIRHVMTHAEYDRGKWKRK